VLPEINLLGELSRDVRAFNEQLSASTSQAERREIARLMERRDSMDPARFDDIRNKRHRNLRSAQFELLSQEISIRKLEQLLGTAQTMLRGTADQERREQIETRIARLRERLDSARLTLMDMTIRESELME